MSGSFHRIDEKFSSMKTDEAFICDREHMIFYLSLTSRLMFSKRSFLEGHLPLTFPTFFLHEINRL